MEDDKPIGQEPEIAADVQPSKPAENETNEEAADTQPNEPTTENETNATDEVTETPEVDQEQDKSLNNGDANKPIESPEPQTEENKKPDVKPMRTTRATKRKANDADENENVNNSPSNEHSTEQKENVEVKSQDSELKENEATKVEESSLKSLSTVDGMGKGKRARIPNKRYSDIILSPNRKASTHQKSFSDIVEPEMSLAIKNEPVEPTLPLEASSSTHSLPKRSRASLSEELRDPKYLKPFKHGWKRELVRRATTLPGKRLSDVYYFNPEGKKLRSFREVSDYLTNSHSKQLSLDNFTFTKEPLGLNDPTKEIVRDAKAPGSTEDTSKADVSTPGRGKKRVATTASDPPPSVEKKKKENLKQAPVETPVKQSASKKIVKMPASKAKETPAKRPKRSAKVEESPLTQPSRSSPRKTSKRIPNIPTKSAHTPSSSKSPSCMTLQLNTCSLPCSIGCEGVQGIIPTLQCRTCLCLYHHECVGLSRDYLSFPYVCKNCQEDTETVDTATLATPPPLTPINTLKSCDGAGSVVTTTALPKLQRIPRPDSTDPAPVLLHPSLVSDKPPSPIRSLPSVRDEPSTEPLVGSVTSWLPHNVKIVNGEVPSVAPRPQYVEYLGGRKFLVIPKHNFMTVSSAGGMSKPEEAIQTPQPMEVPISSASLGPGGGEVDVKEEPSSVASAAHDRDEGSDAPAATTPSPKPEKRGLKLKNITNNVASTTSSSGSTTNKVNLNANFLGDCASIFNSLLHVFQYLKVQDLLRAGRVSRMWRAMANNPLLWRTVRMKNSQVHSFEGLANALKKHGTVHLDLRKMLLPSSGDDIWPDFSTAIARVDSLRKIEFCRCPASVVEQLATSNPNLEVINAVTIKCDSLNLDPFKSLTAIRELRLKSTSGLNINSIDSLGQLKTLKILSLTSVIDLHNLNLAVIGELTNLESLDLGECLDFPENFGRDILLKLDKLEKLRLEKGQGNCHTFEILESIKDMKKLEQLELVNFDVKPGFDKALGACKNIKKLMIIPTYISQSATTNNMVLAGVLRLQGTLVHFVWGVTLELLRVTELFIDQCEDTNKREKKLANNGDCIPVLKPVPDLSNGNVIQPASNPPQVEILPLPNLQKLLLTSLPTTRVKILKIPFHATWRQTLIDSM